MFPTRCRLAPCLPPRPALAILAISLSLGLGPPAWAKDAPKTICCRSSGGTRGTCLNLWAHLVPPGNRFDPGASRSIAVLQGTSPTPTALTLQFFTLAGDLVAEQTLPAQGAGVRLLRLPPAGPPALNQPLVWESFPTCRPNKPPTRSTLLVSATAGPSPNPAVLADLRQSCGGVVATDSLLRALVMEEFRARLPATLPVSCDTLTVESLGIRQAPGTGPAPSVPPASR